MTLKTLLLSGLSAITLSLSACAALSHQTAVIAEKHNIGAEPETQHNTARLIKQPNDCRIEFTGNFLSGKVTQHWIFQGDQLISAFSQVDSSLELDQTQTVFNIQAPEKVENFKALKNNFSKQQLKPCAAP